ncbi:MAG: hypothetical protein AAF703_15010 [Cyanobacteria bacterium P01_D01_bin.105]
MDWQDNPVLCLNLCDRYINLDLKANKQLAILRRIHHCGVQ